MSELTTRLSRRQCVSALAATATLIKPVLAQQAAPSQNIRAITRFFLKSERAADFPSIIKEFVPLFKEAKHPIAASWWRSQTGTGEYAVVSYYSKWSEANDRPASLKAVEGTLAPLRARLGGCIERSERILEEVVPDSSIRSTELPPFVSLLRSKIKPEAIPQYMQLVKSEILPAAKRAELTVFLFTRSRFGEPNNVFRTAVGMKNWTQLDKEPSAIAVAMGGQAAYDKFLVRIRPMIIESEYNLYSHQANLDYNPAA